ncbi:MAG: hypothetical protein ACYC7E_18915 [Armatimonadota bacterium]
MTKTSDNPLPEDTAQMEIEPGDKYEGEIVTSTTGSLRAKAYNPLLRVCVYRQDKETCNIRVAHSEKQASQGRRRQEINKRLAG